ncbi:MAG: hypothetical protein HQL42_15985 [Alphaproteobacteria bacterium]|nr:hypothetical protein [Alphaproteobacteria bacterium]
MAQFNEYIADGFCRVFTFRFAAFDRSDLQVSFDGVPQTAGWLPFGLGGGNGGAIEFAATPASGTVIRITRIEIPPQVPFLLRDENLADIQNKPLARTNLGVYSTTQTDDAIGSAAGAVTASSLQKAANLSDVADVAQARTNLGVPAAADTYSKAQTDAGINAAAASVTASSLQKAANLSDVADVVLARTNLGVPAAADTYTKTQTDAGINAAAASVTASSLQKAANFSDLANVAQARTNLGLVIGTDVQAHDADLDWLSANLTAAGKALLDDADAAAQLATLDAAAANHTHTTTDIPDLTEAVQDVVGAIIVSTGGTYNDESGAITLPAGHTETVSSGTLTGSSVILTTALQPGFDYILDIRGMRLGNAYNQVLLHVATAGPTWQTTNYSSYYMHCYDNGGTEATGAYNNTTGVMIGYSSGTPETDAADMRIVIPNPAESSRLKLISLSGTSYRNISPALAWHRGAGTWNSNASVVGLRVTAGASTFTAGTWRLLREKLS